MQSSLLIMLVIYSCNVAKVFVTADFSVDVIHIEYYITAIIVSGFHSF